MQSRHLNQLTTLYVSKAITYLLEFSTLISDNRLYQSVIVPGIIYILLFPPLAIAGIAKLCGALVNFWSGQQNLTDKNIFKLFLHVFKSQYFFSNLNSNCSNSLDLRNLQEQVKKAFCYQKLIWPFTVWTNCSNDLEIYEITGTLHSNSARSD